MKKFTSHELKEKLRSEVDDSLRSLFAMQYDPVEHSKLKSQTKKHEPSEAELRNRYELIFEHFQEYCSKGKNSIMQSRFGHEPEDEGNKRELWLKKRDELALFMIRVYSGIEDRQELVTEIAEWINRTKVEFSKA